MMVTEFSVAEDLLLFLFFFFFEPIYIPEYKPETRTGLYL
jgi:hypothetical protein